MRRIYFATALIAVTYVGVFAQGPQISTASFSTPSLRTVVGLPEQVPGQTVRRRQLAKLVFDSPVRVMDEWLQGVFLVEHDEDRMERGEPCTHIYRLKDRKLVVAFQCEHLHRKVAERGTVTLKRVGIRPGAFELLEFQYEGSADGHGVPQTR